MVSLIQQDAISKPQTWYPLGNGCWIFEHSAGTEAKLKEIPSGKLTVHNLKMAIEIISVPIKNCFPWFFVCLPEGRSTY